MSDTLNAEAYTQQFYDFELRGRGWYTAPFPVDLEPPFHPFFGFYVPRKYVDDGRKETLLSRLFGPKQEVPIIDAYESPPFEPFPYAGTSKLMGYTIRFPKASRPTIELMEHCLVMLSGIREPISFEAIGDNESISIQTVFRASLATYIASQIKAYFPDAIMVPLPDHGNLIVGELPLYTVDFGLRNECMRPIASVGHIKGDTYTALFGIMDCLSADERVVIQVLFNGTVNQWARSFERAVSDGANGSFFIDAPEMPALAKEKNGAPLFAVAVRALTQAKTLEGAYSLLESVSFAITQASASPFNALAPLTGNDYTLEQRVDDLLCRESHRVGMLLNSKELATLAHFPPSQLSKKLLLSQRATKAAQAHMVNQPYCLGTNEHHGVSVPVGIDEAQRRKHVHILGGSGSGKTTLLKNLIAQDIAQDRGFCCVDCHGDLIDELLCIIPHRRVKDVVLIDPSDREFPVSLNILSGQTEREKELLASDLVALFRRFSTSWGDQMDSVYSNTVSCLVFNTKVYHLGDLRKFLIDGNFRSTVVRTCTDPDIAYYWQKEYPLLRNSSIGSILTRLDSFLRPKVIRNMVCQTKAIHFQTLMDSNKIVLVKIPQGLIGEENSYLLGALIVSKLQQAAMARQAQAVSDRVLFTCYLDEFQQYVCPSMEQILSGGRKFFLSLVLAHQELNQISKLNSNIASSLLTNAATRVCFRLGDHDAKYLQDGFSGFRADDLQSLAVGEAIVRVNSRGNDFNISVTPVLIPDTNVRDAIIAHSRSEYSLPVAPPNAPLETPPTHTAQAVVQAPPAEVRATPAVANIAEAPLQPEAREHIYLQRFVKKLAEQHGYVANIEVPTPGGKGFVDVLLQKGDDCIAVEISVTTTASWELHNIRKCLAAGYRTFVCVGTEAKRRAVEQKVSEGLSPKDQEMVTVMAKDDVAAIFAAPSSAGTETTYKGYKVRVEHGESSRHDVQQLIKSAFKSVKK